MDICQQKGQQIAQRAKIKQEGRLWLVPSQSGRAAYRVDVERQRCNCADFEFRQATCKHLYAVQFTLEQIERTKTTVTENGKTTTTETVKITRKTYKQQWRAYNAAQTHEKERFLSLLSELCKGIEEPIQVTGRPRLPLGDVIFSSVFKVYSTVSGRRFISDLRDAHSKGFLSKAPHYNSIARYLENPTLTSYLKQLIEESALPLQAVETDFAVDSSGFSTCRFDQWVHAKYGDSKLMEKREWVKVHLMCGVRTNVVTSIEVTDRHAGDSPQFKPLVETTARNFVMNEVSADKAYLSAGNLKTVVDNAAMPYIPFKANSVTDKKRHTKLWKQMFHYFSYNQDEYMEHYHKRSNVESTFSMIKAKFGDRLRSKTTTAQINEALCKVLAHNLCCLVQSIFELGIEPTFWAEAI